MRARYLNLEGVMRLEWNHYVECLHRAHICLSNQEDFLTWDEDPIGIYSLKAGYVYLNVDIHNRDLKWWWKRIWKVHFPVKVKLLGWSIMEIRAPTWDILHKKSLQARAGVVCVRILLNF